MSTTTRQNSTAAPELATASPGAGHAQRTDLTEFRLGWKALIVALIGNGTGVAGLLLYGFGAMVVPLQDAFGWERAALQTAISFMFGGTVIAAQLAGWFIHLYGARAVAIVSIVALAAGFVAMTQIGGSIWSLYLGFSCLGVLGLGTLHLTWTQLINTWYDRNRGMALAITLCGTGIGAAVLPVLVTWGVTRWDWRAGFLMLSAILVLITLPVVLLWMRYPSALSAGPAGRGAIDRSALPGLQFRQALRSARFWRCNLALVLVVSGVVAMVTNTIPVMRDKGLSATEASGIFGAFGASLIIGRLLVGYLVDRLWAPGVAAVALLMPSIGCLLLAFGSNDTSLLLLAVALIGMGAGAEYDVASFLVAKYFGMREYSRNFGLHTGLITIGASLTPLLVGALYKLTGSYDGLLSYAMLCFTVGPILLLTLGRYPSFEARPGLDTESNERG